MLFWISKQATRNGAAPGVHQVGSDLTPQELLASLLKTTPNFPLEFLHRPLDPLAARSLLPASAPGVYFAPEC